MHSPFSRISFAPSFDDSRRSSSNSIHGYFGPQIPLTSGRELTSSPRFIVSQSLMSAVKGPFPVPLTPRVKSDQGEPPVLQRYAVPPLGFKAIPATLFKPNSFFEDLLKKYVTPTASERANFSRTSLQVTRVPSVPHSTVSSSHKSPPVSPPKSPKVSSVADSAAIVNKSLRIDFIESSPKKSSVSSLSSVVGSGWQIVWVDADAFKDESDWKRKVLSSELALPLKAFKSPDKLIQVFDKKLPKNVVILTNGVFAEVILGYVARKRIHGLLKTVVIGSPKDGGNNASVANFYAPNFEQALHAVTAMVQQTQ